MHNQAQSWGEARLRDGMARKDQPEEWKKLWIKMIKEIQDTYDGEIKKIQKEIPEITDKDLHVKQIALVEFKTQMKAHWTEKLNVGQICVDHILNPATPV